MFRFFERLVRPFADYPEADVPPTRLWPFLLSFARPLRVALILAALFSLAAALAEVLMLHFLGRAVDLLEQTPPAEIWQTHGLWLLAVALFLLFARPVIQIISMGLTYLSVLGNAASIVRWRAHRHVARQSIGWFENDFAGRIANRINQTPNAAEEVFSMMIEAITYAVSYVIAAFVLLAAADARLMLPLMVWLIGYAGLLWLSTHRVGPASEAHSEARSIFTGRIVDGYTNIHSVKMFAHNDLEDAYVRDAAEQVQRAKMAEMRVMLGLDSMTVVLNGMLVVSVVGFAIWLWSGDLASIGAVTAASALVLRLNAMSGWIMWATGHLFQNIGVVKEGMQTIAQPIDLKDDAGAEPLRITQAEVRFDAVSHHYGRGSGGLDQVSLRVAPGEKIGLVGRSGAGKSTLVKLLMRFYDVEQGQILIDGQPVSAVTQQSLRQAIGTVQQESSLLHRSIRDNLLYGRPDADDAQMIAAARQAQAHEFILELEDSEGRRGYDALVGERGVKLSGGQRQRIALARVILKDAPILVLDEATSALDSEVEAAIQQTLTGMMQGKTVIAIAHRLSTIAQMDRIVVLDQGRIIEDGSHDGLLAAGGLYARLWARQSGGFLGEKA